MFDLLAGYGNQVLELSAVLSCYKSASFLLTKARYLRVSAACIWSNWAENNSKLLYPLISNKHMAFSENRSRFFDRFWHLSGFLSLVFFIGVRDINALLITSHNTFYAALVHRILEQNTYLTRVWAWTFFNSCGTFLRFGDYSKLVDMFNDFKVLTVLLWKKPNWQNRGKTSEGNDFC